MNYKIIASLIALSIFSTLHGVRKDVNKPPDKELHMVTIHKAAISQDEEDFACAICLDQIDRNQQHRMSCGHYFDDSCISTWINSKIAKDQTPDCPLCKSKWVIEKKIVQKERQPNRMRLFFLEVPFGCLLSEQLPQEHEHEE